MATTKVRLGDDDQARAVLQSIAQAAVALQSEHEFPEWRLAAIRLALGGVDGELWALVDEAEEDSDGQ